MFAIKLLPPSELGPDGQRLGEITIGEFRERFGCYASKEQFGRMESRWKEELSKLIEGASVVALIHDPRFAWVLYRDGEECFIQQIGSLDGKFKEIATRRTLLQSGESVSEWRTSLAAVRQFVRA
jgi:hypothetical protein